MTDLKELLKKYNIRTNKSIGQNFLHKTDIIENIANSAAGQKYVLEIGAGPALLTSALCKRFEKAVTVEIDRSLEPLTREVLSGCKNHTMIYADFLKVRLSQLVKDSFNDEMVTVAGNLPYNITGEIVLKLLKNHTLFDKAVIMIQKEAAQKLAAGPSDPNYRAISVLTQYFCEVQPLFDVSPDCFVPAPHVMSSVICLKFKNTLPLLSKYDGEYISFIHRVFSHRRKQLSWIFQSSERKEQAFSLIESMKFPPNVRGEQLDCDQLVKLFEILYY